MAFARRFRGVWPMIDAQSCLPPPVAPGQVIMPRIPRKFVFDPTEVGVYHCINRCVRRAFLCGTDTVSGKCFDHRKAWIQQRLEFLAGNLAVDVLGFSREDTAANRSSTSQP